MHRLSSSFAIVTVVLSLSAACGDNLGTPDAAPMPDAAVDATPDAVPCVPAANRPAPDLLLTGDLVIDPTIRTIAVPMTTVPLDRSILTFSIRENEFTPRFGSVVCSLRDPGTGV